MIKWDNHHQNLRLSIVIQPKASRDQIVGVLGDELKIAVTAPPVDGKANAHIVKFIAKQFGVAKSHVNIVKGQLSRHKQIEINQPKKFPDIIEQLMRS